MDKKIYKQIGSLMIENKVYPVFLCEDGKTYYCKDGTYYIVDWNWTKH